MDFEASKLKNSTTGTLPLLPTGGQPPDPHFFNLPPPPPLTNSCIRLWKELLDSQLHDYGTHFLRLKVKVKVSNYLSTLVQKRTAYRGTHVGAFN